MEDLVFARLIDPILALVHDEMAHFKATYQDQGLKIKVTDIQAIGPIVLNFSSTSLSWVVRAGMTTFIVSSSSSCRQFPDLFRASTSTSVIITLRFDD